MKYLIIIISVFFSTACFSQKSNATYSLIVLKTIGDLNKDKLDDIIVVSQDTSNENRPYKLEVFFAKQSGGYKLITTADSAIQAQYPYGNGSSTDTFFDTVRIENGILKIYTELIRGGYEYKFRYQNNNFVLIGFHIINSDGHGISETRDFNLSTGVMITEEKNYETDKIISKKKSIIKVIPLPSLQKFAPFSSNNNYNF